MLDNVLDVFIAAEHIKPQARKAIEKAIKSAKQERSIGLGAMGFHSYLQSKLIPFESAEAHKLNIEMFSHIRKEAEAASFEMALVKGVAPDYSESQTWTTTKLILGRENDHLAINHAKKHGWKRNMHLLAIAPNASSSIICGNTSPSVEPFSACSFAQKGETGTNVLRNKWLQKVLERKGLSDDEIKSVWRSISAKKGSCQHIAILEQHEKDVFKTAFEIDQRWIIEHAATRQRYIDQAQSINLFFKAPIDVKYLHDVHYSAWEKGLKTLYYLRSQVSSKTEDVGTKVERKHIVEEPFKQTQFKTILPNGMEIACHGCEG
jgi:ribonucleoside-diphosphate reductase alpha chain